MTGLGDRDAADVVIIGGGVAGMSVAMAARDRDVLLVTKESLDESATRYAQGGIAAAVALPDSPELHLADTVAAGAGLCDEDALRVLVSDGPDRVTALLAGGARFDREGTALALAREGGHSVARVLRAGGDATGAEIQRAMGDFVRESGIRLEQDCRAVDLIVHDGTCTGVRVVDYDGRTIEIAASDVVLATGGAGGLYDVTTNPDVATADGLAMALRAGAVVADLEFVQFHPTALVVDARPRPLVSEAVRGEGAVLRNAAGRRFMRGVHAMEDLAPRDIVAQTAFRTMQADASDHVWLDATDVADFARRFPTITALCARHGLDPTVDWLPVAPAAHYFCGGVLTDLEGRTSVRRLWAVGEVACTGVHGANRLASNSLLEGLVFGSRTGEALGRGDADPQHVEGAVAADGRVVATFASAVTAPSSGTGGGHDGVRSRTADLIAELRRAMTRDVGVVRTRTSLEHGRDELGRLAAAARPGRHSLESLLVVGDALAVAALVREESRGCHVRDDFPAAHADWSRRTYLRRTDDGRIDVSM